MTVMTGGVWQNVVFELNDTALVQVAGGPCGNGDTVSESLGSVNILRILASPGSATWVADIVDTTLGFDNITASTVPVELQTFSVE